MKKAMRDHLYAYGRIRGFLTTHACLSEGVKGPAVPQDLDLSCDFCRRFQTETSLVNITNCSVPAGKRERHKPSRCTRRWISTSLRRLGVLLVSRPGVPLAMIIGSMPSVMELMANCTARLSDGLSADGGKRVWIGDVSKGCSSRLFSCISQLR